MQEKSKEKEEFVKKEYLKTAGIALLVIGFIYVMLFFSGLTLGDNSHDFGKQHVKFIEYIRNLIFATHDFMPQLTMNYGLGQSFVILYYHGLYNPFVMLSLILGPNVSIKVVMYFIYVVLLGLISISMHLLARLNGFTHYQSRVISLLTTFSGVVVFHLAWHPMFIYYYPFMILSLVAIHYMVERKNIYLYSIMLGMVFYTNFFFAPIVSIIQFLYLIGLIIDKKEKMVVNIWNFIKAYTLGVLMGALFLIPVYLFGVGGVRDVNPMLSDNMFNNFNDTMFSILNYKYVAGIGIVPIVAIVYSLFNVKSKRYVLPVLFLTLTLIFNKIILLLNLNMYHEFKFFICFIPLLWLVTGTYLFKEQNKWKILAVPVICIVIVLLTSEVVIDYKRKLVLITEAILLLIYSYKKNNYQVTTIITMIIIVATIASKIIIVTNETYLDSTLNKTLKQENIDLTKDINISPYRTGAKDINALESVTSQNPNIYTSLDNANYNQMINKYLEVEIADNKRYRQDTIFDNYLVRNFLSIKNQQNADGSLKTKNVNPIVYGVSNSDVFDVKQLKKMNKQDRLIAVTQGVFIGNNNKKFELKSYPKVIYANPKEFSFKKGITKKEIKVPNKLQKEGMLRITLDANIKDDSMQAEDISINKHHNLVMMNDYYGPYHNKKVTFLIDTNKQLKKLNIKVNSSDSEGKPIKYSNLKIEFLGQSQMENSKFSIYNPEDFKVDMSHSYKFNINQKEDGYLATTIPYDQGFTILVDGKKVQIEKINGLFLGTKLGKGLHKIEIKYSIPGFKVALIISAFASITIMIGESKYLINERKIKKTLSLRQIVALNSKVNQE